MRLALVTAGSLGDLQPMLALAIGLRRIPGAELVELTGVGHVAQVEAFPSFEKALHEFLR